MKGITAGSVTDDQITRRLKSIYQIDTFLLFMEKNNNSLPICVDIGGTSIFDSVDFLEHFVTHFHNYVHNLIWCRYLFVFFGCTTHKHSRCHIVLKMKRTLGFTNLQLHQK
jgi:hypothetical protein